MSETRAPVLGAQYIADSRVISTQVLLTDSQMSRISKVSSIRRGWVNLALWAADAGWKFSLHQGVFLFGHS